VLERPSGLDPAVTTITLTPVEAAGEVGEEEVTVSVGDVPQGVGLLVVKRGPNAGSRFTLSAGQTTIGRHPDSDIFLDDVTVSRRHAEIDNNDASFTVNDVGSLNGTYLNRERIERADLHSGDEVQIGKFRLVFLHEMQRG
jgi:pSer/pThr/pTyr-binding forkhead associated (FHA) protein